MQPKRPRTADEDGRISPPLRRIHRSEGATLHDYLGFAFRTATEFESEGNVEKSQWMMGIANTLAASLTASQPPPLPSHPPPPQRGTRPVVVNLTKSLMTKTLAIPYVFDHLPATKLILVAALAQSEFVSPDHSIVIHGKILSYSDPAALVKTFAVSSPFLLLANTDFLADIDGTEPLHAVVVELFEVAKKLINWQQTAAAVPRDKPIPQAMQNEARHVSLSVAQLIARLDLVSCTDEVRTARRAVITACHVVDNVCEALLAGLSATPAASQWASRSAAAQNS
ncbi:Hypothetical protein, putative [Bodo saltans]|uniref:Uncharacterized protein n=1 Tax=Bodo saltans TaxID=75058 RepID=A0A0S4JJ97_BODSA|nr:Hypothetical protein, putative [Bodo saltans]|eukprot:CUG91623.1 Hypothetical protein, putative [Bodo saltans]